MSPIFPEEPLSLLIGSTRRASAGCSDPDVLRAIPSKDLFSMLRPVAGLPAHRRGCVPLLENPSALHYEALVEMVSSLDSDTSPARRSCSFRRVPR